MVRPDPHWKALYIKDSRCPEELTARHQDQLGATEANNRIERQDDRSPARYEPLRRSTKVVRRRAFLLLALLTLLVSSCEASKASPAYQGGPAHQTTSPTHRASLIGYVGCSNTTQSVAGARSVGFTGMWPVTRMGGGTIQEWATGQDWDQFDQIQARYPASTFWFELCELGKDHVSEAESYATAAQVIQMLETRVPGATVYVSAINDYVAPHACGKLGASGPANLRAVAKHLVANGLALRGPNMGALRSADPRVPSAGATAANDETETDGCHPNESRGQPKLGAILAAFFSRHPS